MRTIKIFKLEGGLYRTIDDPKSYSIDKESGVLTVNVKRPDDTIEIIKTNLPFFLEEDAPKAKATVF